jgi:nitrogen regulatory protein PII
MKKIEAYIKTNRLDEVVERLHAVEGLTGLSVLEIRGFGRTRDKGPVRIVDTTVGSSPHVKLEVFCLDAICEEVIGAIQTAAHTGLRADGKIYVSGVEGAVRISTGEQGDRAV